MKKGKLVLAVVALSLTFGSTVFAREGTYSRVSDKYTMRNSNYSNMMTEEEFNSMSDYMKKNFGYSMMGDSYEEYSRGNGYRNCCNSRN